MTTKISVIIIVKNDLGIGATLNLLQQQTIPEAFETIVVDASAPSKLRSIRDTYPEVLWDQYDQCGKDFTFSEQRNRGLALSSGEYIVFIDANCLPSPDWLKVVVESLRGGEDIVCGPCLPSNESNMVHYTEELTTTTYVRECTTINVGLRRSVVDVIGEFDERMTYGEDVDFFWRAREHGFMLCYEPLAGITHDYGSSDEQRKRAYRYGKSRAALHKKHWRTQWYQLLRYEPHVWIYPLFIVLLPLAIIWPYYLLVLLIPVVKNRSIRLVQHHLIFACGVLIGVFSSL